MLTATPLAGEDVGSLVAGPEGRTGAAHGRVGRSDRLRPHRAFRCRRDRGHRRGKGREPRPAHDPRDQPACSPPGASSTAGSAGSRPASPAGATSRTSWLAVRAVRVASVAAESADEVLGITTRSSRRGGNGCDADRDHPDAAGRDAADPERIDVRGSCIAGATSHRCERPEGRVTLATASAGASTDPRLHGRRRYRPPPALRDEEIQHRRAPESAPPAAAARGAQADGSKLGTCRGQEAVGPGSRNHLSYRRHDHRQQGQHRRRHDHLQLRRGEHRTVMATAPSSARRGTAALVDRRGRHHRRRFHHSRPPQASSASNALRRSRFLAGRSVKNRS